MSTITLDLNDESQLETVRAFLKALKIKFIEVKSKPYNPDFVAKIEESKKQIKEGKVTSVPKEDLKNFLSI